MAKSKKKTTSRSKIGKKELRSTVSHFLSLHPGAYFTPKQLFKALKFTTHPLKMLCIDVLNEMIDSQDIVVNEDGEFSYNGHTQVCEGTFTRTNGGRNYVDLPDGTGVSVYDDDTMHALPGDKVKVSLFAKKRGSEKIHGQIIEILQRNEKPFIGSLQVGKQFAFLVNPDGSLPHDILIPIDKLKGGHTGEKALVKVTSWPENARNPIGEVVDILGESGNNDTEMHAILAEFGLPYKYPEAVQQAANRIDPGITPEEIAKREDFRDVLTFTIDPRDAKDFDDAISIRSVKKGVWEVGVHIADVSHYVLEGSIIDKEAQQRGTSVYLVDRTVPMLPERLCNFICSLRPDEEKLSFSVVFEMNEDADVLNHRIVHTVIKSDRRFVYEEVQHVLEQYNEASPEDYQYPTPEQPLAEGAKPAETYKDELIVLNRMAHKLRERRMKNGAIDFDRVEPRFDIDEKGKPLSVYFKRAKDANKLVEEFMLLANRTVAESVGKVKKGDGKAKTLPYRVHDMPDPTKLDNLEHFVSKFGYMIRTQGTKTEVAKSLNKLLKDVKDKPIQQLVETVSLRAMMKARYSTINIGHYGLAFDFYTHFTSPIRRYPDLMVHRLLTRYAEGARSASQQKYEALCEHASDMEQLAANAERASIKYKQVEFMADKIGEEFDATISGVTDFGVYAEIDENHCEGLISVRFLGDEPFDFDERNYCLTGRQTHHKFSLGDKIRIKVAKANLYRKQLDFDFVRKLSSSAPVTTGTKFYLEIPKKKGGKKKK
ncbi:MAG: ribonuclease R [Bacteroidaceae bacterium]|nr:ribonuclease R [Bacteroidaceae bacterium]